MSQKSENSFQSAWWSVKLPPDWNATEDEACVTLSGKCLASALQISAARKEGVVTEKDLEEFALERLCCKASLHTVQIGVFSGLYAEYTEHGIFWRQWWLRTANLLIYCSYNIEAASMKSEISLIDSIVNSLNPKD